MPDKPWEMTAEEVEDIADKAVRQANDFIGTFGENCINIGARAAQRKLVEWLDDQMGSDYHNQQMYTTLPVEVWDDLCVELGIDA